jgi:hypothetical protein
MFPRADLFFQPLWHKRFRRAEHLIDVLAEDRVFLPLLATEGDAGRRLGGQDAAEDAAAARVHRVSPVAGDNGAARVEHVHQKRFIRPVLDRSQVRSDGVADAVELVALRALFLEHLPTFLAVAGESQGRLVLFEDALAVVAGDARGKKRLRPPADRGVLVLQQLRLPQSRQARRLD